MAITKIRLSSHLFNIERGRWGGSKIERKERKCTVCNVVEDEYHCLLECPRYVNERRHCLPERLKDRPCMLEFINFLRSQNAQDQHMLGALCYKVQREHKNFI